VDDFWKMIVDKKCNVIVMLTRCIENRNEKCASNFPLDEGEIEQHDSVSVMVKGVQEVDAALARPLKPTIDLCETYYLQFIKHYLSPSHFFLTNLL